MKKEIPNKDSPLLKDKNGDFIQNRCVNKLRAEVLKEKTTQEDALEYLKKNTAEIYELPEGFQLKGIAILGVPPVYLGLKIKKKEIVFYFHKPCFGIYLMKIKATDDDFAYIRANSKLVKF
ncbi:MAG: DUF1894 domain-containing protein [Methanomicrobium sp.]|jgi:hypothetical protein|nr:DUF1894 domain-containing protein [Methanomicrobium sp.]